MFKTSLLVFLSFQFLTLATLPDGRPEESKRTFQSTVIDNLISTLTPLFIDPDMATLFANCLPNTLDTTVSYFSDGSDGSTLDSFVITGDIDALWLRDSGNQVVPYLPYGPDDAHLQSLFEGLIARHARSVILDPFANSFNFNASGEGHQSDRRTPAMTRSVFEGKYEIDSLAAFLKLSYWHYHYSGAEALTRFATAEWLAAVDTLLDTVKTMQEDTGKSSNPPYLFQRTTSEALDTLIMQGRGPPVKPNGMTRSLFRPSDDAVTLSYNIPGNAMICVELNHLQTLLAALPTSTDTTALATKAGPIADNICNALKQQMRSSPGLVLPYEVDGLGSSYYMDDANVPSLLSLPLLGLISNSHPVYKSTRSYVLSEQNPYYFSGSAASGVGGPHVGFNYSWPMAIVTRAMTSSSVDEVKECLDWLLLSTANTGFMHESFNVNNVFDFTRTWFAWANGLFGELVLQVILTHPELLIQSEHIATAQAVVKSPVCIEAQKTSLF